MKQWAKFLAAGICISAVNSMGVAWAQDVPVIDLNQNASDTATPVATPDQSYSRESLSDKDRLRLLEQQMANLIQMNLPAKIDNLQQQIQQLNGQLEVQAHDIQTLTGQQSTNQQPAKSAASAAANLNSTNTTNASTASNTSSDQIAKAETNVTQNTASAQNAAIASDVAVAGSEENAYQRAFDLLATQKTDAAITAFQAFLKTYPHGTYAPNAHYWLGELYNKEGKTDLASQQFTTVIQQYPKDAKVPDAMYKLATIQDIQGQHDAAKQLLQKLVQQFPNSAASRMATIRLQEMPATDNTTPNS